MADRISISPEQLETASSTFKTNAGELDRILNELRSTIDNLMDTWEGAAQITFFDQYAERETTLKEVPGILEGIGGQLSGVAKTLLETDEQISSALKG